MEVNVWRCCYCMAEVPEGRASCERCDEEHEIASHETRIKLGSITYSRETVALGPTGIVLVVRGHIGRRAIDCEYLPQELHDKLKEFVLNVEMAHLPTEEEVARHF